MNNKEFYQRWGRSTTLEYLVNTIVVVGMEAISQNAYYESLEINDQGGTLIPGPVELAECYRDLKQMPPGFIKNVIKKVL